ncbi:MAG: hypothetical protein MPJ79_05250 [Alphaproteobacteria bacterium]|nr:hypothetical protein [Alphaproteobacteria bacterium]MDA7989361.1 hypothetical protein [Alphaproteobacteria bacterium]MDA8009380.1 hypothetical protein [Alphaproteobacteria bacterium]
MADTFGGWERIDNNNEGPDWREVAKKGDVFLDEGPKGNVWMRKVDSKGAPILGPTDIPDWVGLAIVPRNWFKFVGK